VLSGDFSTSSIFWEIEDGGEGSAPGGAVTPGMTPFSIIVMIANIPVVKRIIIYAYSGIPPIL
jgi:hypothetical protein